MPSRQDEKATSSSVGFMCFDYQNRRQGRILDVDFSQNFSALITVMLSRIVQNKKPFFRALGDSA